MNSKSRSGEKPGGVPSLFSHTIKETQKLGARKFISTQKYVRKDINIGESIVGKDADLEGFGDVLQKVKKEDVQVPAGALRKHKMVKQISGRFNNGGRKKGLDIFALIDDAIDKEPTEEAKEKARERAAAKKAAAEAPIPPKVVKMKAKSFKDPRTKNLAAEKTVDASTGVPAMFASSIGSNSKKEPAWKMRLKEKQSVSTDEKLSENPVDPAVSTHMEQEASPALDVRIPQNDASGQSSAPEYNALSEKPSNEVKKSTAKGLDIFALIDDAIDKEPTEEAKEKARERAAAKKAAAEAPIPPKVVKMKAKSFKDPPPQKIAISQGDVLRDTSEKICPHDSKVETKSENSAQTVDTSNGVPAMFASSIGSNSNKEPAWKMRLKERQSVSADGKLSENSIECAGSTPMKQDTSPTLDVKILQKGASKQSSAERKMDGDPDCPSSSKDHTENQGLSGNLVRMDITLPDYSANEAEQPAAATKEDDDFSVSISSVESDGSKDDEGAAEAILSEPDAVRSGKGEGTVGDSLPVATQKQFDERSCDPVDSSKIQTDVEFTQTKNENSVVSMGITVKNSHSTVPGPSETKHGDKEDRKETGALPYVGSSFETKPTVDRSMDASHISNSASEEAVKAVGLRLAPYTPRARIHDDSDSDDSDSSTEDKKFPVHPIPVLSPAMSSDEDDKLPAQIEVVGVPEATRANTSLEKKITLVGSPFTAATPAVMITVSATASDRAQKLFEAIKETEKMITASGINAKLQMAELRKNFENVKESLTDEFEEKIANQRRINQKQDRENQKVLDEEKKILENLRVENKQLRATSEKIPRQIVEIKQTNASLEAANEEIAGHFNDLNKFTKKLQADHDKLTESSAQCRDEYLPRYRHELRERQMFIDTETKIKILYRECSIKIAKHVSESRRAPSQLSEAIQEIIVATASKVDPKFDPRILCDSSSSDSSSSDSDSSSDSGSSSDSDSD